MRPWNPHSLTRNGSPIVGQIPVRYVVYGPPLTPKQSAMLQGRFANFVSMSRQSVANNPSATGTLPDGSRYAIDCVGGACTCAVWTVDGEASYIGGIGICLTTIGGAMIPGHINRGADTDLPDDDRPQLYILTPELENRGRNKTRMNTGKWKIRKVDYYDGGKASSFHPPTGRYITSVPGYSSDAFLSSYGSSGVLFSTERAYKHGAHNPHNNIIQDHKVIGRLGRYSNENELGFIPFYSKRKDADGRERVWIMQFAVRLELSPSPARTFIDVYGAPEKSPKVPSAPIGELLSSFLFPAGYGLRRQTMSVSPNGDEVRLVASSPEPNSLAEITLSLRDGELYLNTINNVAMSGGGTTTESNKTSGGGYVTVKNFSTIIDGSRTTTAFGFGYDGKGRGVTAKGEYITQSTNYAEHIVYVAGWLWGDPGGDAYTNTENGTKTHTGINPSSWITIDGVTIKSGVSTYSETSSYSAAFDYVKHVLSGVSFTGVKTVSARQASASVLYVDPTTKLAIYQEYIRDISYSVPGQVMPIIGGWTYGFAAPPPAGDAYQEIVVECKGRVLLRESVETRPKGFPPYVFYVSAASDPRTGAVCVNLLKTVGDDALVTDSWIFLADDKGAKHLHEVMDIPKTTDIRIKSDVMLLSV